MADKKRKENSMEFMQKKFHPNQWKNRTHYRGVCVCVLGIDYVYIHNCPSIFIFLASFNFPVLLILEIYTHNKIAMTMMGVSRECITCWFYLTNRYMRNSFHKVLISIIFYGIKFSQRNIVI